MTESPLSGKLKAALFLAAALVFITALQLLGQSAHTDRYFAWTIKPPITAAFLGSSYLSTFVLLILAARQRSWDRARVAILPLLVFLPLMVTATFVHLDRFRLNAGTSTARVSPGDGSSSTWWCSSSSLRRCSRSVAVSRSTGPTPSRSG